MKDLAHTVTVRTVDSQCCIANCLHAAVINYANSAFTPCAASKTEKNVDGQHQGASEVGKKMTYNMEEGMWIMTLPGFLANCP